MTRYVQDWERCINCKESGRGGKIIHLRGCPDRRQVNVKTTKATTIRLGDILRRR